jgi:DNA-binding NtrC family response regulator
MPMERTSGVRGELLGSLMSELEGLDRRSRRDGDHPLTLREWLDLAEAWHIAQGLRQTGGNRSAAARLLGIGRRTLYRKIDKLGFSRRYPEGEGHA